MWPEVSAFAQKEFAELHLLCNEHSRLVAELAHRSPSPIERSALGAMLQSQYNGIENVFRRIALEFTPAFKKSEQWHVDLLDLMAQPPDGLPPVIPEPLKRRLLLYLGFRHVFRGSYSHRLNWDRMRDLVLGSPDLLRDVELQIGSFLRTREQPG